MPRIKKTKSPATDVVSPDVIPYERAVRESQEILLNIEAAERGQLRLGELADKLEPKYGDRTLAKFADEIGVAKCTLDRYRTVWRAWEGKLAPGPNFISYAVLRELATHDDREEIIRKQPDLTKRKAHDLMRKQASATKEKQERAEDWVKHNRRWFKELCNIVNEAARTAEALDECTPEQQENLRQAIDPNLLLDVRRGGRFLIDTADRLAALCGLDPNNNYDPIPSTPFQTAAE
jgi:hypothetical protein